MLRTIICLLFLAVPVLESAAFTLGNSRLSGIGLTDSVPAARIKPYTAWIEAVKTDSIAGKTVSLGTFKGRLTGFTDTSLLLQMPRPYAAWKKAGRYYEVPYSDVEQVAYRKTFAPLVGLGIGYVGGAVAGAIIGVRSVNGQGGGQQELANDLGGVFGAVIGAGAGTLIGWAIGSHKTSFKVHRDKAAFSRLRVALQRLFP